MSERVFYPDTNDVSSTSKVGGAKWACEHSGVVAFLTHLSFSEGLAKTGSHGVDRDRVKQATLPRLSTLSGLRGLNREAEVYQPVRVHEFCL